MTYLKERIIQDGVVIDGRILKIDSFLNHQIDPKVISEIEKDFYNYFKDHKITKIFTIEASGIAPALQVAQRFQVPMLFAKKAEPSTLKNNDQYSTDVYSYTKEKTSKVLVSKQYLDKDDHVLIIDDFLANGEASLGLIDLVNQAGATVAGVGICVEKSFQPGRQKIEDKGIDIYSICRIQSFEDNKVVFVEDN